jgi:hypothetical protein
MVYGAAGEPGVVATVCALLALRVVPMRQEIGQSLNWLERAAATTIQSPGSLALVEICFKVYRREWPSGAPDLSGALRNSGFLDNTVVAAWAVLASGSGFWLEKTDARTAAA